jgi:preprotein translocase subunit Sss1
MSDPDAIITEYRSLLVRTEQASQSEFDKSVLALSGGSLALSFAFTKDILGTADAVHSIYLLLAWAAWTASSTSVLMSFFTSQRACRKVIRQLDAASKVPARPGGWLDFGTEVLNIAGLVLFVVGLVMMVIFLNHNLNLK